MRGSGVFSSLAAYLVISASSALAGEALPSLRPVTDVGFERHVMGILGRMGCNAGSCHGSFQGRGGMRLSLFGSDPEKDFVALARDPFARRINSLNPDASLLLLKATGQFPHGGGKRFDRDSWAYRQLRAWIEAGTPRGREQGALTGLVLAKECLLEGPDSTHQLEVLATFRDGSTEDVTRYCEFRSNDDSIVDVSATGHLAAHRPGDTTVVALYRGVVATVHVLHPVQPKANFVFPQIPESNYIDRLVFDKLRRLNIAPADLASDEHFLRRITIDTTGTLPTPAEIRQFLADPDPLKRDKKIDRLLDHPYHAAVWATRFSDITGNNTDLIENPRPLQGRRSQMWYDWLRVRLAQNAPLDQIVEGILCATSRDGKPADLWLEETKKSDKALAEGFVPDYASKKTLDLFWRRQGNVPLQQWGEKVAAAFLGVRLECAQCHKHPFDRWTQADYLAFANIFAQVGVGASPETKSRIDAENEERRKKVKNNNQLIAIREVFVAAKAKLLADPETRKPLLPTALGGFAIPVREGTDPRRAFMNWLRSPKNPYFARNLVNRVWGHYFGVGLVEPLDNFSQANPPSNEKLLDALAADFVAHGFDLRHLERTILRSRVYQLSAATNATSESDRRNYSHAYARPVMAEMVVDMLADAIGVPDNFGPDAPDGSRAMEIGASRLQSKAAYAFRVFGRPSRALACDCDRSLEPALPQTLYRMTDTGLLAKIPGGRLRELLKSQRGEKEILEELFLATLSRMPTDQERDSFREYCQTTQDRRKSYVDAFWALLNTREFVLNH